MPANKELIERSTQVLFVRFANLLKIVSGIALFYLLQGAEVTPVACL